MGDDALERIDRYLDAVARAATRPEPIGPFTLFIQEGPGWPYYARPTLGATSFTAADASAVRERQRALGIPEAFEWVVDRSPAAGAAIASSGLRVIERPLLLALEPAAVPDVEVRFAQASDDIATLTTVQHVAFSTGGTAVGDAGPDAVREAGSTADPSTVEGTRARVADGRTVMASVWVDGAPVAAGAHQPVGGVTEVVGIGTLPAYRRRGLGAALTAALVADARGRGIELVFCSADDDDVARVYEGIGFVRVGTFADAQP